MGLCDWQLLTLGHGTRDLAYAVSAALAPRDRRVLEDHLVRLYVEEISRVSGQQVDFDPTWDNYRHQMLTALAMWTITLRHGGEMPDMQPEDMSLAMVERIGTAIDDLNVLA